MDDRKSRSGPSMSRADRPRKKIELTLSDDARARLEAMAERDGESRSQIVEALILAAP